MAPTYVLGETSAGYVLLKSKDKKLLKRTDLHTLANSVQETCETLKLKNFVKWDNAASAVSEATAIGEGRVTPMLATLLKVLEKEDKPKLVVADIKLASSISQIPKTVIVPVSNQATLDITRAVREHISSLVPDLAPTTLATTNLGLAHSLSRHQLKFSADKVDVMIIQAISLLDDLDKELNTYAMRVKEWYGWHFPEMAKIINDNVAYARVVIKLGMRSNASTADLSDILPEEIEGAVKMAAEISMGTEISDEDLETIESLADQVVDLTEFRVTLSSYLSARMQAIAPNLTAVVGELVGARLIAHAGSLISLSKSPASTIQILGAENALFRALKTKHDTPKYGLIYHASLIGQASGRNKGKMSRMLAAKAALSLRIDAQEGKDASGHELPEDERAANGINYRSYLERRLQHFEGRPITGKGAGIAPVNSIPLPGKFDIKEARKYNVKADGLTDDAVPALAGAEDDSEDDESEDEEDEEDDETTVTVQAKSIVVDVPVTNGTKKLSKEEKKAAKKAAKKTKKDSDDEAVDDSKAAKKARKEAKKARKEEKAGSEKKRKRDDDGHKKHKKAKVES
jgi:nucleolar protein 58